MMISVDVEDPEAVQVLDQSRERPSRLLAIAVEKPRVRLRYDEVRRAPPRLRHTEQRFGLLVPLIPGVQEGDEDPGVEEDRLAHGSDRPYTTSSTVLLSSGRPSSRPANAIQG